MTLLISILQFLSKFAYLRASDSPVTLLPSCIPYLCFDCFTIYLYTPTNKNILTYKHFKKHMKEIITFT